MFHRFTPILLFFFFFQNHTPLLVFLTSFCDITHRSMLRLAEGMHTPIALHCSGFIFNVGKSGRNRQILTEHFVKVRPFLFPFTISESNLIYSECVNLFFFLYVYIYVFVAYSIVLKDERNHCS